MSFLSRKNYISFLVVEIDYAFVSGGLVYACAGGLSDNAACSMHRLFPHLCLQCCR
jgi:hypothetical protein